VALFFWAFLWQIPHFLAITLFRGQEYTDAGFPVLAHVFGENVAKLALLATSWLLVLSTLGLYATEMISMLQLVLSLILGIWFLFICHRGAFHELTEIWAKRAFRASLLYQGLLFVVLIVAALINH
jgi:protoheme IX farnesyltransferase